MERNPTDTTPRALNPTARMPFADFPQPRLTCISGMPHSVRALLYSYSTNRPKRMKGGYAAAIAAPCPAAPPRSDAASDFSCAGSSSGFSK